MYALLQTAEAAELPGGYGVALLQTLFALAAVCILAWVVLRWGARRGLMIAGQGRRVRVLERIALDARRSLYVVEVGDKLLLLGAGETGAPATLAELDPKTFPPEPEPTRGIPFADILRRLGKK